MNRKEKGIRFPLPLKRQRAKQLSRHSGCITGDTEVRGQDSAWPVVDRLLLQPRGIQIFVDLQDAAREAGA
jgi:hypothetical protein